MKQEPEAPRVVVESPEKQVNAKVQALVSACTATALAEVLLARVRGDRESKPELISDAAVSYRQARSDLALALEDLLTLQARLFTEAGST